MDNPNTKQTRKAKHAPSKKSKRNPFHGPPARGTPHAFAFLRLQKRSCPGPQGKKQPTRKARPTLNKLPKATQRNRKEQALPLEIQHFSHFPPILLFQHSPLTTRRSGSGLPHGSGLRRLSRSPPLLQLGPFAVETQLEAGDHSRHQGLHPAEVLAKGGHHQVHLERLFRRTKWLLGVVLLLGWFGFNLRGAEESTTIIISIPFSIPFELVVWFGGLEAKSGLKNKHDTTITTLSAVQNNSPASFASLLNWWFGLLVWFGGV